MADMIHPSHCLPLVSVIIPAYNYAGFLSRAIDSILDQTYKNVEIIVVDDGSDDQTNLIIQAYTAVRYIYQEHRGVSSARNTGIQHSTGAYIVFLDADDWLEPAALEQNLLIIQDKPAVAFVSGNYYLLRADTNTLEEVTVSVTADHYLHLLRRNYIGMLAAVMFQRWVLEEIRYDESLKACEDYELYLSISRKYPVLHHQQFIATYYFHRSSLSHKYEIMTNAIKTVMERQLPYVHSAAQQRAYAEGMQQWKDYDRLIEKSV